MLSSVGASLSLPHVINYITFLITINGVAALFMAKLFLVHLCKMLHVTYLFVNECLIVLSAVFFMQPTLTFLTLQYRERVCVLSSIVEESVRVFALKCGKWRLLLSLSVNECIDVFTCSQYRERACTCVFSTPSVEKEES